MTGKNVAGTLRVPLPTLLVLFVVFAGCGSTQVAPANRQTLAALQTAVSAKNTEWLGAVAQQLDGKRTKGEISGDEFRAFNTIIQQAKAGQWDAALKRVFALSEAQRPTAEDLARLRERKPASPAK